MYCATAENYCQQWHSIYNWIIISYVKGNVANDNSELQLYVCFFCFYFSVRDVEAEQELTLRIWVSTLSFTHLWILTCRKNLSSVNVIPSVCATLAGWMYSLKKKDRGTDLPAAWSRASSSGTQSNWTLLPAEPLRWRWRSLRSAQTQLLSNQTHTNGMYLHYVYICLGIPLSLSLSLTLRFLLLPRLSSACFTFSVNAALV